MATSTETPLNWIETTALPAARAFGSAFSAGNMIYYLGGSDGTADTNSIYYTYINPSDGTLGFPASSKFWETNPIPLPMRLSHFGYACYDGRIFLVGGISDSVKSDAIFQARLHANNLVGQWYRSPQTLPAESSDMSTVIFYQTGIEDTLVVAGGVDSNGKVLQEVGSYPLSQDGFIAERQDLPDLPKPLAFAVLLGNGSDLITFGGYNEDFTHNESGYTLSDSGYWQQRCEYTATAEGPSVARVSKQLWYLGYDDELVDVQGISKLESDSLLPDIPNVFPGSGFVTKNSRLLSALEPESTLQYRLKGDSSWLDVPASFSILEDADYELSDNTAPEHTVISRRYQVRSLGFIFSVSGSLSIQQSDPVLETIYLRSSIVDAEEDPLSSVWVKLRLSTDEDLVLTWSDSTSGVNPYTGSVRLSLFEDDFNTEARDVSGYPVSERTPADHGTISLSLQKGTYYLLLEDVEEATGTSVGIAVSRE